MEVRRQNRRDPFPCAALLVAVCVNGCIELSSSEVVDRPVWRDDIERVVRPCLPCHTDGRTPPVLDRYTGVASCRAGDDGPVSWTSSVASVLAREDHASYVDRASRDRIERWVSSGAPFASTIAHPAGFADPTAGDVFHGALLRRDGFRRLLDETRDDACMRCHGRSRDEGGAAPCTSCHTGSFAKASCDGCHGADGDPMPVAKSCDTDARFVGAHAMHPSIERSTAFPSIPCSTCHEVPSTVTSTAHVGDGTDHAEVRFDRNRVPRATYDSDTMTCSNVDCHAGRSIAWTKTSSSSRCDRCHGFPPTNHASDRCVDCHRDAFDEDAISNARHLNGAIDVPTACDGCHGNGPPPTFVADPGAHRAHASPSVFARGFSCDACHQSPTVRDEPGHIDSALPAEVVFTSSIATAQGRVAPAWEASSRTCSDVACHGAHLDGGMTLSPEWTNATDFRCGDCHALPPVEVAGGARVHLPTGATDCGYCHRTNDGDPITEGIDRISSAGLSVHIDGRVDLAKELRR